MRRFIYCLTLFTLPLGFYAKAQSVVRGTVVDRDTQKGVPSVNVTIQEKGSVALVSYTLTDEKGAFTLEYRGRQDSIILSVVGFNINKESRTIANRSQELTIATYAQAISIHEVKVVAPNIRQAGDTIKYSVGAYVAQSDRTIGDILKKLPGIEIKESGEILYNNRAINNYYIEGLDLLKGRYGLANSTIEARDVAEIQVMENHQPIKALEGVEFTEAAAINLKLKAGAKGVLMVYALLGAGVGQDPDLLLTSELSAMYFNKKMQNITTCKGNNTGFDVSREQVTMLGGGLGGLGGGMGGGSQNWLSVQSPATPAITQNRYLNNQVHALSFNNVWKLAKEYQLNANVNYTNDRQDKRSYSRTDYLLPGDTLLTIAERLSAHTCKNQASADIILNANTKQFYLDNNLSLKGMWDSEYGNASTPADTIDQYLNKPDYSLNNAFRLIKNFPKTSLTFSSTHGYTSTPHDLQVEPMLYDFLFDHPLSTMFKGLKQELLLNTFSSANSVAFGFDHGKWKQNYSVSVNANLQKLSTLLSPQADDNPLLSTRPTLFTPDSLSNDLRWDRYEWQARPSYSYLYNRVRATIGVPLQYVMLRVNDHIPATKENTNRLFLNPSLSLWYKVSPYWEASINAVYQNSLGGINNAYTGYLMTSYRNLQRNEGKLYEQQRQNYNVNLSYRNPIYALFGSVGATCYSQRANLLFGYNFTNILRVQTSYIIPNTSQGVHILGNVSKGFDVIASTIAAGGSYTTSSASQMDQGTPVNFTHRQVAIHGSVNTKIQRWANISYRLEHTQSQRQVEKSDNRSTPIHTYSQRAQLNLFPIRDLTINFSWEHFYNSAIVSQGSRNMSFGDINIRYKLPKVEFSFDYTNTFNTKEYISVSYSNTGTYYYAFALRPAEVMAKVRFKIK